MTSVCECSNRPVCLVLLATYNGQDWLPEQLNSIADQQGVTVRILVSDDNSSDDTMNILQSRASSLPLTLLPTERGRYGSANQNFLRMIRDADIVDAEYVALADQDDIWITNKLAHAIRRMEAESAAAYSSDFEAFWSDGRKLVVKKSHSQKPFDHLFSSPGPGCTFVLTRAFFLELRAWITTNFLVISQLWMHDWIIYAYARGRGHRWLIDNVASLRYRQHKSNQIGANSGVEAVRTRLALVRNGRYRHEALMIAVLTDPNTQIVRALHRFSWVDRLWLIWNANQFRRSARDVWALRLIFVLLPAEAVTTLK